MESKPVEGAKSLVQIADLGLAIGVIDTFFFWILENMGASKSLMGLTVTVGSLFGIFIMIFATPIIERIGHVNTLTLGLVFFVIRLLGYAFIRNPWWAMPFEAMECFSTALFNVAQLSYAASLSTPTTIVSFQTLSMSIMHGIGRGIGGFLGGFLTKGVGLRGTFQLTAGLCALAALIYFALNIFFFRKMETERKLKKENLKKIEEIVIADEINKENVLKSIDIDACKGITKEIVDNAKDSKNKNLSVMENGV